MTSAMSTQRSYQLSYAPPGADMISAVAGGSRSARGRGQPTWVAVREPAVSAALMSSALTSTFRLRSHSWQTR